MDNTNHTLPEILGFGRYRHTGIIPQYCLEVALQRNCLQTAEKAMLTGTSSVFQWIRLFAEQRQAVGIAIAAIASYALEVE